MNIKEKLDNIRKKEEEKKILDDGDRFGNTRIRGRRYKVRDLASYLKGLEKKEEERKKIEELRKKRIEER